MDVLNMSSLPNAKHTEALLGMCDRLKLVDPYPCFFQTRKDFTYVPRCTQKKNRSRLDFFLVSTVVAGNSSECDILPNLQNKLFDHKAIILNLKKKCKLNTRPFISNFILKDDCIDFVVLLAAFECHLHHHQIATTMDRKRTESSLKQIGNAKMLLRQLGPSNTIRETPMTGEEATRYAGILAQVNNIVMALDLSLFKNKVKNIEDDIFLEYLIMCIRNDVVSYQTHISKQFNMTFDKIVNEINELKNTVVQSPKAMKYLS